MLCENKTFFSTRRPYLYGRMDDDLYYVVYICLRVYINCERIYACKIIIINNVGTCGVLLSNSYNRLVITRYGTAHRARISIAVSNGNKKLT